MSERRANGLLPVTEAVNADMPWLWWARTGGSRLAGMPAPPDGFPFSFLRERGFDTIVSLAGPVSYDPSPLSSRTFTLQDLARGAVPADSAAEEARCWRRGTAWPCTAAWESGAPASSSAPCWCPADLTRPASRRGSTTSSAPAACRDGRSPPGRQTCWHPSPDQPDRGSGPSRSVLKASLSAVVWARPCGAPG